MSHLVHNEQMKLAANLCNNLGVVSVASGFIAPLFSTRSSATPISFSASGHPIFGAMTVDILVSIFVGLLFCVLLEIAAHGFLLRLKE